MKKSTIIDDSTHYKSLRGVYRLKALSNEISPNQASIASEFLKIIITDFRVAKFDDRLIYFITDLTGFIHS